MPASRHCLTRRSASLHIVVAVWCLVSSLVAPPVTGDARASTATSLDGGSTTSGAPLAWHYWVDRRTGGVPPPPGTLLGACDECHYEVALPFPVTFFDQVYETGAIWANGFVTFGPVPWGGLSHMNEPLPTSSYNPAIFPFWDDLSFTQPGDGVYTSVQGSAPYRAFVIEWRGRAWNDHRVPVRFALWMYEGSSDFDVIYETAQIPPGYNDNLAPGEWPIAWDALSATIGLQKSAQGPFLAVHPNGNPVPWTGVPNGTWHKFVAIPYVGTTTTVTSASVNSGQTATLSTSVKDGNGNNVGSGTIQWFLNGVAVKGPVSLFRTPGLPPPDLTYSPPTSLPRGTYQVTVAYSGSNHLSPSQGQGTLTVLGYKTTASATGPAESSAGDAVQFTLSATTTVVNAFGSRTIALSSGSFEVWVNDTRYPDVAFPPMFLPGFPPTARFVTSELTPGTHTIWVRYLPTDADFEVSDWVQRTITVTASNTAPTFTAPAGITTEATSAAGAVVTFTAGGDDAEDGPLGAVCAPASGSTFPLGTTTVSCTVTDVAGASASGSFTVTVVDTTAPVVTYTGNVGTYQISETVAITCAATDAVGVVSTTCADITGPATGFVTGANMVTSTATDAAGNTTTASTTFTVVVTASGLADLIGQIAGPSAPQLVNAVRNITTAPNGTVRANRVNAFKNQVNAQLQSRRITPAHAALLLRLVDVMR